MNNLLYALAGGSFIAAFLLSMHELVGRRMHSRWIGLMLSAGTLCITFLIANRWIQPNQRQTIRDIGNPATNRQTPK